MINRDRYRVVAVASGGGHLQQLERIAAGVVREQRCEWILVTPGALPAGDHPFARVDPCTDFSRDSALRIFRAVVEHWRVLRRERPDAVVTTGAAPGLVAIACARLCGIRALWIDSVANARRLSLSGRLARLLGATVVTQWPEVARRHRIAYAGRIL